MKLNILTTLALAVLLAVPSHQALAQGGRGDLPDNPIPIRIGDPFILHASDGNYYMYGSTGSRGYNAYMSPDLKNWESIGQVFDGDAPDSWADGSFWANEVFERNGKYYMFYSANWKVNPNHEKENFRLGVAVSDSPRGPFKNMYDHPIFDPGFPIIDADVYFDDENGKVYLYGSRCCYKHPVKSQVAKWAKKQGIFDEIEESWIYGVELKPDFSGIIGKPKLLLRPPKKMNDPQAEWESRSVTSKEANRRWTEGSFIFKDKDTFYILYSANFFGGGDYAVGYATSKSPLGPFVKSKNNPILQKTGQITGTGHCMILNMDDGRRLIVYHGKTKKTGNSVRLAFIDEIHVVDGKLVVDGPTMTNPEYIQ